MSKHSETRGLSGPKDLSEALDAISGTLNFMAASGCRGFDCSQEHLNAVMQWGSVQAASTPGSLGNIQSEAAACVQCGLSKTRRHVVFGEGDACARLVFVGEGPGHEEDKQGRPFVGPAGQLLTKIVQAMGLEREQVYICNIIKCRPPGNRNPEPGEIAACLPFLERQLSAVRPEFVCALGAFAARTLLKTEQSISRLRGRLHSLGNMRILPTYHPAYLLRNPARKREVWEDIKILIREMGL